MLKTHRAAVLLVCLIGLAGCTTRTGENLNAMNNWTTQEKKGNLIVGMSILPTTPDHNSLFLTVRNHNGEPIEGAKVAITSLKQFLFSTDRNIASTYVAIGTYRLETNMPSGSSEINFSITPISGPTTNFRCEAHIP